LDFLHSPYIGGCIDIQGNLLLLTSICVVFLGFIIGFIFWIGQSGGIQLPYWWSSLGGLEFGLWYAGEFLYWLILILKIDYIYRLPFDVHRVLVISRTNGVLAYETHFATKKSILMDNDLLAGFFSALNNIFLEVGRKNIALESVAGPGMNFIIDWGEYIATLMVTDQDTYYLRHAMTQFTRDFEKRFAEPLRENNPNSAIYETAKDLIEKNFPFFRIQK
jgi:hypothetical protein